MVELGEFALSIIMKLLTSAIQEGVKYTALPFFERRKIERRVEDATAAVVEPLLPFLAQERIPEDKQLRLIETCVDELRPLTKKPALLFQGSLNGQKIFEELYASRDLPQVVIEDGLKEIYTLLCPRIATLLCRIPAAVKEWESEAWTENFRRFDEITTQLRTLFSRVDELATLPSREADETLLLVRRTLAQKIGLELDLTGLRSDRPLAGKFDDFFVHPEIKEAPKDGREGKAQAVGTSDESFDHFVCGRQRAIVIAPPGAGKSTWTRWLQRETLSARWTGIGIRVELRRFSNEPLLSLHDLIREAVSRHLAEELTAERISRWLNAEQVVFILDGFDEIGPSERNKVYEWLVDLSTAAWRCSFVLTSRPLTTNHLERLYTDWQAWNIEPFDEARIIDYIQRWYTYTPLLAESNREVDAVALARRWRADPTIGPLTGNPLLLSTLLMVHHLDGSLPSGRSQLYRRYVEGMLGLWDDRRKVAATTVSLSLEQKRQIMRGLALHMFLQEYDQLDEPAMLALVRELLQQMHISLSEEDVLAALRERSGLIVGPGIYNFTHKSIAEYFVAEAVLQGDQRDASGHRIDRLSLFEHRDNDRWNTVIFLWAGLAPVADVELFIDECIKARALALGYGILCDQYERIPAEIRRRLLLEIISGKRMRIPWVQDSFWIASRPSSMSIEHLPIPSFRLRGLTPHTSFVSLLEQDDSDGTLEWSDCINAKGKLRELLWMVFVRQCRIVDEWKACLKAYPKGCSSAAWWYWVAETIFSRTVQKELTLDLGDLIEAYKESCPLGRGLISIALISTGLRLVLEEYPRQQQPNYEGIVQILKGLPKSGDDTVIHDWLLGTRKWSLAMRRDLGNDNGDLLAVFVEEMENLVAVGALERDMTYERAISFVKALQARREALYPS